MNALPDHMRSWAQLPVARCFLTIPAFVASLYLAPASVVGQEPDERVCRNLPTLDWPPAIAPPSAIRPELDSGVYWPSLHAHDTPVSLGVGHLRVTSDHYDWLREVSIPLFERPDASDAPLAWIRQGWLDGSASDGQRRRISYRGAIETEYERATAIVLELRADGWFRFRYDLPPEALAADAEVAGPENWLPTDDGTAWTHECYLGLGEAELSVQLWRDLFFGPDAPPLSFVDRTPHALREDPAMQATRLAWVEKDDEVEALEIRDEWMRVRVSKPGKFLTLCTSLEEWDGETLEGWVKWWDPEDGPWLWYPTRGC
jgi:hypothetical protein